jgi:outer membrane murein-binding lipoprotein Lpp
MTSDDRIAALEARVEALNGTLANVLSTLVLHGVLTRPAVDQILAQAKTAAPAAAAASQVEALQQGYPAAMREAMGPPPEEDDHDH